MNTELMEALNVLEKEKNIRKEVVLKAIEESLVQACKHHFGKSDNIVVNMDYNTGEYEINMAKEVVENVEDQQTQISLPNAKILDKRAVYGSTVYVKVNSKEFGRIAAQIAKASMPIDIVIPESGLSDSIFDAQNGVYEADADFSIEHQFEHLSDVVDVPDRQSATMS